MDHPVHLSWFLRVPQGLSFYDYIALLGILYRRVCSLVYVIEIQPFRDLGKQTCIMSKSICI